MWRKSEVNKLFDSLSNELRLISIFLFLFSDSGSLFSFFLISIHLDIKSEKGFFFFSPLFLSGIDYKHAFNAACNLHICHRTWKHWSQFVSSDLIKLRAFIIINWAIFIKNKYRRNFSLFYFLLMLKLQLLLSDYLKLIFIF